MVHSNQKKIDFKKNGPNNQKNIFSFKKFEFLHMINALERIYLYFKIHKIGVYYE